MTQFFLICIISLFLFALLIWILIKHIKQNKSNTHNTTDIKLYNCDDLTYYDFITNYDNIDCHFFGKASIHISINGRQYKFSKSSIDGFIGEVNHFSNHIVIDKKSKLYTFLQYIFGIKKNEFLPSLDFHSLVIEHINISEYFEIVSLCIKYDSEFSRIDMNQDIRSDISITVYTFSDELATELKMKYV